jgi:hypothetical protein
MGEVWTPLFARTRLLARRGLGKPTATLKRLLRHADEAAQVSVSDVSIVNFSDCRGHDYAIDLRRCAAYSSRRWLRRRFVGSPENEVVRIGPLD